MGENEERNERSEGTVRKSAKPSRIAYVPIAEEDLAPYEPPVKKKHKALKITGLTLAMILAVAGSAYAGISYYYSDKFFFIFFITLKKTSNSSSVIPSLTFLSCFSISL